MRSKRILSLFLEDGVFRFETAVEFPITFWEVEGLFILAFDIVLGIQVQIKCNPDNFHPFVCLFVFEPVDG